ncbi:MAG TPA: LysM domain-containing protein [Candidatus Limnocylindrales bacterium]
MQEQVEDQDLAGLARPRHAAARPTPSADPTILGPAPAPLDCPYLHFDDDGSSCLALAPAIRLSRRQVELVCAVAAHVACPRLTKADAGRVPVQIEPPPPIARRRDRRPVESGDRVGSVAAATAIATADASVAVGEPAATIATDATAAVATTTGPGTTVGPAQTHGASTPEAPAATAASATSPEPFVAPAVKPERLVAPARPPERPIGEDAPDTTPAAPGRIATALALVRASARTHIVLRPATAAAWVILLATLVIVVALLTAHGGITLPTLASPSAGLGQVSPSAASSSPSSAVSPSAAPSLTPSPTASPSASVPSSPSPSPQPSPSASPPFSPAQLAVLTPCPGKTGCYQYRIKPNDSLRGLAKFFGVTYPALLAANPQITNPSIIHVGERVTIPIPTATPSATPKP